MQFILISYIVFGIVITLAAVFPNKKVKANKIEVKEASVFQEINNQYFKNQLYDINGNQLNTEGITSNHSGNTASK